MSNGTTTTNTSGETNVQNDYTKKKPGVDCIPDKQMAEIARRLQSFVVTDESGDVVFTPDPPNLKTKLWVETDVTGAIVGTIKRYDSDTGQWVDDHTVLPDIPENLIPKIYIEEFDIGSNDATIVINHNFSTARYFYTVTPLEDPTEDGRWYESGSAINSLTLKFIAMSGVSVKITVVEYLDES